MAQKDPELTLSHGQSKVTATSEQLPLKTTQTLAEQTFHWLTVKRRPHPKGQQGQRCSQEPNPQ